jgi:hypothetical protein
MPAAVKLAGTTQNTALTRCEEARHPQSIGAPRIFGRSAAAWAYQAGKCCPLSGHRGGRCLGNGGTDRGLNCSLDHDHQMVRDPAILDRHLTGAKQCFPPCDMIESFAHKDLEELFKTGRSAGVQASLADRVLRRLDAVRSAKTAEALNLPGLSSSFQGQAQALQRACQPALVHHL